MLHHIGLQIIERDLQPFYLNVLGCIVQGEFILPQKDASQIFSIAKEIKIIYTKCEHFELELFIDDDPKEASFNHVCFHTNNNNELANKAQNAGFNVFIRQKKEGVKTYFISDSNKNYFEIKNH